MEDFEGNTLDVMVPKDAILLVKPAPGIALYDVSFLLPQHKTKKYRLRDPDLITRIYVHHSGKLGAAGFQGLYNSARYSVEQRKNKDGSIGWPGQPYHIWVPFIGFKGEDRVAYLCQPDSVRCYHTGKVANTHGYGIVLQGNTSTDGLSFNQQEILEGLLPWKREELALEHDTWLSWHSEAGRFGGKPKPACPGSQAQKWLEEYRELS